MHTTLKPVREGAEAAATRQDLRLDDDLLVADQLGGRHGFIHGVRGHAEGDIHAAGLHEGGRLVLVDVEVALDHARVFREAHVRAASRGGENLAQHLVARGLETKTEHLRQFRINSA